MSHEKRITKLKKRLQPLQATDDMPQAALKILGQYLMDMLRHEAGSRTGQDIEDVHKMRVATRRMRSALRIFKPYFRSKVLRPYEQMIKDTAKVLGDVRDLDVMLADLKAYQAQQTPQEQSALQEVIDKLKRKNRLARVKLIAWLDTNKFQRFVKDFARFVHVEGNSKGKAAIEPASATEPYQVRHVAPVIFYAHLAAVRAYDNVIAEADIETLHALRIEFKRLRYVVTFFEAVLGASAERFIDEIKALQEYLGRLNDVQVAQATLSKLSGLSDDAKAALGRYFQVIQAETDEKFTRFPQAWAHFNSRTVQRQLSDALLVLR